MSWRRLGKQKNVTLKASSTSPKPTFAEEVNAGDSLKSILNVGDFTRQFKCDQYIPDYTGELDYMAWDAMGKCVDLSYCEEIFVNTFHCKYKELTIFITA